MGRLRSATATSEPCGAALTRWILLVGLVVLVGAVSARAQVTPCDADDAAIAAALARIRSSVDPCGESPQVGEILAQLAQCTQTSYRICTDTQIDRNVFDRPLGVRDGASHTTITWNPKLHSQIDQGCDGDPTKPVDRDPTASLLHELVHALQDCRGLNPGKHELDAVRIENIYRRAAGLCQRRSYGDQLLPAEMVKLCDAESCSCSAPLDSSGQMARHGDTPSSIGPDAVSSTGATQAGDFERRGDRATD
jgi:hypothetical protein